MTADALALCGCVPMGSGIDSEVPMSSEQERNLSRTVTVVNYLCALGAAGMAQVVVVNGIAQRLDY